MTHTSALVNQAA